MRIREMTCMGCKVWPPTWSSSSHPIDEKAVLRNARFIVGTDLIRIDIDHDGIPHLGIMVTAREVRDSLYHKLKENLGRKLAEIADLEIDLDQESAVPRHNWRHS